MFDSLALLVFPLLMIFAALADLFTMTIPNRVSLVLIAAYLLLALYLRLPLATVGLHVSCGLAMLALTFMMFQTGWIGGGDAKLAAAIALWLGWGVLLDYSLSAAIYGGALTIVILLGRRQALPLWLSRHAWIARLHDSKTGVPYGVALAAAGMMFYPHTEIWRAAAGL